MRISVRGADILAGAALGALGLYIVQQALRWDFMTPAGPGPGFFPLTYGSLMVALSLLLVVRSLRNPALEERLSRSQLGRALAVWVVFLAAVALLPVIGFLLDLVLLTLFIAVVLYGQRPRVALMAAVGIAAGFGLVFNLALGLDLPTGVLGF